MSSRNFVLFMTLAALICVLSSNALAAKQARGIDGQVRSLDFSKAVPGQLNYQGFLVNAMDSSAVTATLEMTFRLFDTETKGAELWFETHPAVEVNNGLFQVLLGSVTPFPDGLFDGSPMWLQTDLGTEVLAPRKPLVSTAYSHRANSAEMLLDYTLTDLDDRWVNEDQANSVTSAMIADGEIADADVATGAAIAPDKIDGTAWTAGNDGAGSGLDADMVDGQHAADFIAMADLDHLDAADGDPANAVYVDTAGKVGIGTISPSVELDVNGSVNATTYFGDGSNLTGISVTTDGDWTIDGLDMYSAVAGNVGIGTADPSSELDVVGTVEMSGFEMPTGAEYDYVLTSDSSGVGTWKSSKWTFDDPLNPVWIHPTIAPDLLIFQDSSLWIGRNFTADTKTAAVTNWNNDGARALHCWNSHLGPELYGIYAEASSDSNDIGVYGLGDEWGGFFTCNSGGAAVRGEGSDSLMYGELGTPGFGIFGHHPSGNYGWIGSVSYAAAAYLQTSSLGDYAMYGDGTDQPGETGTGYDVFTSLGGVKGYNYEGNSYTFGTAGFSWLDAIRSGACLGAKRAATVWGCLAYKSSTGSEYGGYLTSYGSGTGKGDGVSTGIGLGAWGDLFGADIHGQVYGTYTEGDNYGLYSHGTVFKDDLDVHLQDTGGRSASVLYTNVSTDVTVQTSGYCQLSEGVCSVEFDENFQRVVSPDVPVVVTVTPMGSSNGVHLDRVDKNGFTVVENNGGKGNAQVGFIAIGRRAGYETPQLPEEIISSDYVQKLSTGLHNDADTATDGEGLYYESGQLYVGMHPSVLAPADKSEEEKRHSEIRRPRRPRRLEDDQLGRENRIR